ncbi:hypothetical protein C0992_001013, partial [Termitomyces sp. T32_za158]
MVRAPLNVIPTWIVQILQIHQTGVALNRIAVYLDEDEVDGQVSSLKQDASSPILYSGAVEESGIEGLGIERASFKWNEVERPEEEKDIKMSSNASASVETVVGEGREVETETEAEADHKFELRDINVKFPEGELTLITGPTASGKTALL